MEHTLSKNGLRFECTRCSNCCRHEPGYVFLSRRDIERICRGLGIDEPDMVLKYCRTVHVGEFKKLSLKEKKNYDCIFWENDGCSIYEHRPLQCRSYPFWMKNVESENSWRETSKQCPGIGKGKLYKQKEIEAWLTARLVNPPV